SPASYSRAMLAPGAIATVFGNNISSATEAAKGLPLPTTLGAANVTVFDKSRGRFAPLFVATPNQINFLIPEETPPGPINLLIYNSQTKLSFYETLHVTAVAPAVFAAHRAGFG